MRHELERAEVATLLVGEFLLRDITDISYNLSQMLWRHVRLLCFNKSSLALLAESIALRAQPFILLLRKFCDGRVGRRLIAWRRRRQRHGRSCTPSWGRRRRRWQ